MASNKRQMREQKKREKLDRFAELQRRGEEKRTEQLRQTFPKFDTIKVLSIGEGPMPGFAHALAQRYLREGVAGKVVSVDLYPAAYRMPQNMAHVKGNAVDFLKILPPQSVERIHDHFTTHHIRDGHYSLEALKTTNAIVDMAKAGDGFAQSNIQSMKKTANARLKAYFREIRRVLRPGGKLVLVNQAGKTSSYESPIRSAGLTIRFSKPIGKTEAARLGIADAFKWIPGEETMHAIIAAKPGRPTKDV